MKIHTNEEEEGYVPAIALREAPPDVFCTFPPGCVGGLFGGSVGWFPVGVGGDGVDGVVGGV